VILLLTAVPWLLIVALFQRVCRPGFSAKSRRIFRIAVIALGVGLLFGQQLLAILGVTRSFAASPKSWLPVDGRAQRSKARL
jgi:hypothetical protein